MLADQDLSALVDVVVDMLLEPPAPHMFIITLLSLLYRLSPAGVTSISSVYLESLIARALGDIRKETALYGGLSFDLIEC
mgnify:CR=1 FL=1